MTVRGLLTYGIPNFKLDKEAVKRRIKLLEEQGVVIALGSDISDIKKLYAKHDAVLIATGVYKAGDLRINGKDLDGVYPALQYLECSTRELWATILPMSFPQLAKASWL